MKKFIVPFALGFILISAMSSCFHRHNDFSIRFSDDDDEFEMEADYPRHQSHNVKVFLNDQLLNHVAHRGRHSFKNEEITLDDNTTFYIDAAPGEVNIRVDKDENSEEGYIRVKELCQGLKLVIEDH
jgi:hypothetical protein